MADGPLTEIAEATKTRLIAVDLYDGKIEVSRIPPTKTEHLPIALVAVHQDTATASGRGNHGEPDFTNTIQIVIVLRESGTTGAEIEKALGHATETVLSGLLSDSAWVNQFEGVAGYSVQYRVQKDASPLIVDAFISLSCNYHTIYPPIVEDDFAKASARDPGAGEYGVNIGDPDGPIDAEFEIGVETD